MSFSLSRRRLKQAYRSIDSRGSSDADDSSRSESLLIIAEREERGGANVSFRAYSSSIPARKLTLVSLVSPAPPTCSAGTSLTFSSTSFRRRV